MKKILLLSALGLSSMLSHACADANNGAQNTHNSYDASQMCDSDPCGCVCCDCTGPGTTDMALTVPAGPKVGDCSGFIVSADFIYWFSKESNLKYATEYEALRNTDGPIDTSPVKSHQLSSEWAPGFKVGLGMNSDCDNWTLLAQYTWYQANKSDSTSVDEFANNAEIGVVGTRSLTSVWVSGDALNQAGQEFFSKVSADWDLHFNQIDLSLSRHFWLSECTTVEPFLGIRTGWTRTDFDVKGSRPNLSESTDARIHQKYWGVGFVTGTRSTYQFTECFGLYGSGDFSVLWGDREVTKKVDSTDDNLEFVNWTHNADNCSAAQAILDLDMGLSYTSCWCEDQNRLRIDLGWEYHHWFAHSNRPIVDLVGISNTDNVSDLTMSGLNIKVRFDF